MKNNITIVIYAHDDEKDIQDCIKSAQLLTSNIIVIDIASQDETVKIAKENNIKVITSDYSLYVEPVRMFGIKHVATPWFFILDADERITPELAEEIKSIIDNVIDNQITHYQVPRKNIFKGKTWLRNGGWWPDYQIRLIKTNALRNWPIEIHSTPKIEGQKSNLANPLLHFSHGDLSAMVEKTIKFESLEADMLYKAGRSVSVITLFRKFVGELYRRLIKNKGFADHDAGIIESIYQAFSKTVTYLFLYEKKKSRHL